MATRERIDSPFRASGAAAAAPAAAPRLELRPLTGWEEEYLERHLSDENTARLCNEVLARCLVAPGADPGPARDRVRALLVAERDRELVALRRMSLGPDVAARVTCPECARESEADVSLDALALDVDKPASPVVVDAEGVGQVVLRLPTAGDQEDLADAGLAGDAERRSWVIGRCLERYGDREGPFDADFARGLSVGLRARLEAAIDAALPDLDLQMAVTCPHCGASIVAPFDVSVFFFRN